MIQTIELICVRPKDGAGIGYGMSSFSEDIKKYPADFLEYILDEFMEIFRS